MVDCVIIFAAYFFLFLLIKVLICRRFFPKLHSCFPHGFSRFISMPLNSDLRTRPKRLKGKTPLCSRCYGTALAPLRVGAECECDRLNFCRGIAVVIPTKFIVGLRRKKSDESLDRSSTLFFQPKATTRQGIWFFRAWTSSSIQKNKLTMCYKMCIMRIPNNKWPPEPNHRKLAPTVR